MREEFRAMRAEFNGQLAGLNQSMAALNRSLHQIAFGLIGTMVVGFTAAVVSIFLQA